MIGIDQGLANACVEAHLVVDRLARDARLIRSLSRKWYSPDNATREGFFGRLKTELFYPRIELATTIEQFIQVLDSCIGWYDEKRIAVSLGSPRPLEYRERLATLASPYSGFWPHPA